MLATSLKTAEKVGKSFVSAEQALHDISKESEKTFQEALEKQAPATDPEMKLTDVTHKLFEKQVAEQFPDCSICIYKGMVANLISWGRSGQGDNICGILSGNGKAVSDAVICNDFQSCNTSDQLSERLKDFELQKMGLVVWVNGVDAPIDKCVQPLRDLKSPFDKLLLLVMCGGCDPMVYEACVPDDGDVTFSRCSNNAISGRKKDQQYRVVDFKALGKSTGDNMTEAVSSVFQEVLRATVSKKLEGLERSGTCEKREHHVPADGLCFWHCIVGSLWFDCWSGIPRKDSGYSENHRILKQEEDQARDLMKATVLKACEQEGDKSRFSGVLETGCVDISDIHWIASTLSMNIRCTIEDEAGSGWSGDGCVL